MLKRGQISSETLVYALTIVIVGFILVMGHKYLSSNTKVIDKAELLQFQNKLSSDIKSLGKEYGTFRKITYQVPNNVEEVCFVDLNKKNELLSSKLINYYPLMKDSVESDVRKNIFFVGASEQQSYFVDSVVINHYPYMNCFQQLNNKIEVGIEGLGDSSLILADFISKAKLERGSRTVLKSADQVITLEIPAGTQANSDIITIEMIDKTDESGATDMYKFGPSGTTFSNAIQLKIKYNPAVVGECPSKLEFYHLNDDGTPKEIIPSKAIDCESKVVVFDINSFSLGFLLKLLGLGGNGSAPQCFKDSDCKSDEFCDSKTRTCIKGEGGCVRGQTKPCTVELPPSGSGKMCSGTQACAPSGWVSSCDVGDCYIQEGILCAISDLCDRTYDEYKACTSTSQCFSGQTCNTAAKKCTPARKLYCRSINTQAARFVTENSVPQVRHFYGCSGSYVIGECDGGKICIPPPNTNSKEEIEKIVRLGIGCNDQQQAPLSGGLPPTDPEGRWSYQCWYVDGSWGWRTQKEIRDACRSQGCHVIKSNAGGIQTVYCALSTCPEVFAPSSGVGECFRYDFQLQNVPECKDRIFVTGCTAQTCPQGQTCNTQSGKCETGATTTNSCSTSTCNSATECSATCTDGTTTKYCRSLNNGAYTWVSNLPCSSSNCGSTSKCSVSGASTTFKCTQLQGSWQYYQSSQINFQNDPNNCGTVCNRCPSGQTCNSGQCISTLCTPNWQCTQWSSPCSSSGTQTRTCTDSNNCGTSSGKPDEVGTCTTNCPPSINCDANSNQNCEVTCGSSNTRYYCINYNNGNEWVTQQPSCSDSNNCDTATYCGDTVKCYAKLGRFAYPGEEDVNNLQEDCSTDIDDDCDGQVNEGCTPACTNECNQEGEEQCSGSNEEICAKVGDCLTWQQGRFCENGCDTTTKGCKPCYEAYC